MAGRSHGDLFGRVVGGLVFLGGVFVICVVLWLAFQLFRNPNLGLQASGAAGKNLTASDIALGFMVLLGRIALLFVGSISGSLIANKGINLYFAGLPTAPRQAETPIIREEGRDEGVKG
jgi:hypothetical protein